MCVCGSGSAIGRWMTEGCLGRGWWDGAGGGGSQGTDFRNRSSKTLLNAYRFQNTPNSNLTFLLVAGLTILMSHSAVSQLICHSTQQ